MKVSLGGGSAGITYAGLVPLSRVPPTTVVEPVGVGPLAVQVLDRLVAVNGPA